MDAMSENAAWAREKDEAIARERELPGDRELQATMPKCVTCGKPMNWKPPVQPTPIDVNQ